ncbi:hypothetical protein K438DRAFT_1766532 [Mycena galopus ATCC 62051]|nr:hypothetical protein K438DRAFT_1766532 [Mycena galopus ATCC 62051]
MSASFVPIVRILASGCSRPHAVDPTNFNPVVEYFALPFFPAKPANTSTLPDPLDTSLWDSTLTDAHLTDADTETESETGMQDPLFWDGDIDPNALDCMDMDDFFEQDIPTVEFAPDLNDLFVGPLPMLTDSEHNEAPNDITDTNTKSHYTEEPLSLVKDSATIKKLPILYKSTQTHIPHFDPSLAAKYYCVAELLLPCDDPLHKKKILRTVKETTKLYTVGPMDFCGHAKAVRRGGAGKVISLCRWDPSLNDKDQRFIMSTWEALGGSPKGFRKDECSLIKKAVAFKAAAKKLLSRSWTLDRKITEADVDREVAIQKAALREATGQKILQKAAAALKRKSKKPKKSNHT